MTERLAWRDQYVREAKKQGRTIHYYLGSLEEYMPTEDVVTLIEKAYDVQWKDHLLDHDLLVKVNDGGVRRLYRFDVREPRKRWAS